MPIPPKIRQEVEDVRTVAAAASRTSTRAHTVLRGPRKDVPGLPRIATDCQAVHSCANGEQVEDTAANVFLTEIHRIVHGIGPHRGVPERKVGVVLTHAYAQPDAGSITTGYVLADLCERSFKHIETLYPDKGVFDLKLLIVPIHMPGHWALLIVDFEHDRFELYDTLITDGGIDRCNVAATHLTKFLTAYAAERPLPGLKGMELPRFDAYARLVNTGLEGEKGPIQRDGTSCGIFILSIAMFRARGWALCLKGSDAPELRIFITYTIAAEAEHDPWPDAHTLFAERVRMPPPIRAPPKGYGGYDAAARVPKHDAGHDAGADDRKRKNEPRRRPEDKDVKFIGGGVVREKVKQTPRYNAMFNNTDMFGGTAEWDTDNPPTPAAKKRRVHIGVTIPLTDAPERTTTWTPNPGVVDEAVPRGGPTVRLLFGGAPSGPPVHGGMSGVSRSAHAFPSRPAPVAPRRAPVDTSSWLASIRAPPPPHASV